MQTYKSIQIDINLLAPKFSGIKVRLVSCSKCTYWICCEKRTFEDYGSCDFVLPDQCNYYMNERNLVAGNNFA